MLLCFDKEEDDVIILGASPARGEARRFFPTLHRKVYNVMLNNIFTVESLNIRQIQYDLVKKIQARDLYQG